MKILDDTGIVKILTIDDEFYIRQSIRTYLEDFGFIVLEAESGLSGIEVFDREHPDLVLLDLKMPEMDGLQVLEIFKNKAPDIPVIVASGTGNINAVVEALHLGAWDYILKPIEDLSVLYHSIQECLEKSRLKKENKQHQERLEELVRERTLELQQSEERYRAVFEYTGTAAVILESDGTISMVNSKFAELVCMDPQKIAGKKKWYDFVPPEDIEVMQDYFNARVAIHKENQSPLQYEIKFITNNKEKKYVFVSLGIIPGTDRAVASLLDITEKKKAAQQWRSLENQLKKSQKMEAIGTLAGGIAHDLNNILSPILGYADMIMRSSDPETSVYKRSEKIQKAALRAADLVSQVLFFSRRGEEEKRRIRIHPVLKEVVKLLKGSIPSTITIVDRIARDCGSVEADPTQIHQVVMNLCTNAYHAMEKKGGILTVGLEEINLPADDALAYPGLACGKGCYLAIEVSDTGHGMSEDIMERIFDPYFSTKEEGKGTGLGLATVYSIVKACKGGIRVKSRPDTGTIFTILLPVLNKETRPANPDIAVPAYRTGSGERILIVDDDQDIARMCKEGLEVLGYKVELFFSSLAALDFFKENHHHIDLVVTDQTMPGKTGFDLAKEMLAIKKELPVILCSGYAGAISKAEIKEAGIKKFIMKPVTIGALSKKIQKLLK